MMRRFHQMRRHEEGQALVLAAVSMLILTLCVLATVNLAYAASEKIKLQNAADSAAYSVAAFQARALNFMAYTNRAMVVHYAGQMNCLAITSYMYFALMVYTVLAAIPVPVLQQIFTFISQAMRILVQVLDWILQAIVLFTDGLNIGLSITQFAVKSAISLKLVTGVDDEISKINAATNRGYEGSNIARSLLGVDAARRWEQTVDINPMQILTPGSQPADQYHRAMMTEIANSARHRWTAYGGPNGGGWTVFGIPRHAGFRLDFGIGKFAFGKWARTEYGSYRTSGGFLGGALNVADQLWSLDRFELSVDMFGVGIKFTVDSEFWSDRRNGGRRIGPDIDPSCSRWIPSRICRRMLRPVLDPIRNTVSALLASAMGASGSVLRFHLGQVPFARYDIESRRGAPSGAEFFKQPPVLVAVTLPKTDLVSRGRPFLSTFGARIGSLQSNGGTQLDDLGGRRISGAPKRGWRNQVDFQPGDRPLPFLQEGFHAMSAAIAYYHRPGDWREPPNLFNPFWGAKLMPVADYPTISGNPVLRPLFDSRFSLMAH